MRDPSVKIVRYELEYKHGRLFFVEDVASITTGKLRLRYVLNHTHCEWPVEDVTLTGFDADGAAQVIMHYYNIASAWTKPIFP